jgi:hypothetical protein
MLDLGVWHKFLRYTTEVLILYLLFKYLPDIRNRLNLTEIGLIILTVLVISIFTDVCCTLAMPEENESEDIGESCQCAVEPTTPEKIEGFEETAEPVEVKEVEVVENVAEPVVETKPIGDGVASDAVMVKPNNWTTGEKTLEPVSGYYGKVIKEANRDMHTSRMEDGVMVDELKFTDYNHLPLASGYKNKDYEYGYSFLPPKDWYPQPPRPPVCVTEKRCPVCPSMSSNGVADMKEWDASRRITPPDLIDTEYVSQKLNAGR